MKGRFKKLEADSVNILNYLSDFRNWIKKIIPKTLKSYMKKKMLLV